MAWQVPVGRAAANDHSAVGDPYHSKTLESRFGQGGQGDKAASLPVTAIVAAAVKTTAGNAVAAPEDAAVESPTLIKKAAAVETAVAMLAVGPGGGCLPSSRCAPPEQAAKSAQV